MGEFLSISFSFSLSASFSSGISYPILFSARHCEDDDGGVLGLATAKKSARVSVVRLGDIARRAQRRWLGLQRGDGAAQTVELMLKMAAPS